MKKINYILFALFSAVTLNAYAQNPAPKSNELCNCASMQPLGRGVFYFGWGYNFDRFSKSDIHFHNTASNPDEKFDFSIYDAKASDNPGLNHVFSNDISIPQYAFRIGYYFNRSKSDWGVEINYDHAKYIVDDNQTVHIKGHLAGLNGGRNVDTDTLLISDEAAGGWFHFEHTNGANFALIDLVRRFSFFHTPDQKFWLSAVAKAGIGFVVPRTNSTIRTNNTPYDYHRDDKFHVAGYMGGTELALRADFLKNFFFETAGKFDYVNYTDALIASQGRASHHFLAYEYTFILGAQFPF